MDFGGLAGARLPLYAAGAASWTRTVYRLNHLDVSDPYMPGRAIFFPGVESIESFGLVEEEVQLATRRSQPRWQGRLSSHLTGTALAWGNLPTLAERAGLLRSEKFRWYTRDHLEFGGGLGRRAEVFFSGTGHWASQSVPREPVRDRLNTRLLIGTAGSAVRLGKRDRLRAAFTGSRIDLSGFGMPVGFEALVGRRMAPPLEPHPDQREEDHLDSVQAGWVREAGRANWEVRYGYGIAHLDTATPPWDREVRIDLLDGSASGAPPLANLGVRTRHELEALWRAEELSGGRTRVAAGVNWQRAAFRNRLTIPGDRHLIWVNGQPSSLAKFNTPLDSRGQVSQVRLSAGGSLEPARWISLSAGLAVELARGSIPPQSSPAGAFAAERLFRNGRTAIVWNASAPWAGVLFAPPVPGNLRFRGHYRRSLQPLAGRYLDFANPNSLSGQEYRWPDRTLLRRFGGEYSAVDSTLRRPYVDELSVSVEATLPGSIEGGLRLFRHDDRRRMAAINEGVPFDAYRRRLYTDPGADFIPGTFDDQTVWIFEQNQATFGQDRFLLANASSLGAFSSGMVAELSGNCGPHWWRLTFAAEKGYATTNPGNAPWENDSGIVGALLADPNTLLNATGRVYFDRAYLARFHGSARLPRVLGSLEAGAVASYWDGLPFGRRLLVEGLAQGPVVLMATPRGSPEGGHRTEYQLTVDVRLSRRFPLRHGALRVMADVFNLPNLNNNTRERDLSGPDFNLRLPLAVQPPRFVRLGFEYEF